jgi:ribulose-5-phosphate 4-epimerase/fuculose-1-phosphate aldolase
LGGATFVEAANTAVILEEMAKLWYEVLQIGMPRHLPEELLRQLAQTAKKNTRGT